MSELFQKQLKDDCALAEAYLANAFRADERYADLQDAMEYSLLAGGKRLRPVLVIECCKLCGGDPDKAIPFAAAVEMIHTYSLIHDDLPAMDNDDMRRGRPTNHKVYGEATAILAGDALLTAAFEHLAKADLPAERIVEAVTCLSRCAGAPGMVGGQVLDMAGEGRSLSISELEQLQSLKTGALISAAAQLGCIAAGGSREQHASIVTYAQALGRAFQIRDDMLDEIATAEELGKPIGSDRANEKSTFLTALGLDRCQQQVDRLTNTAVEALSEFEKPEFLIWLAEEMANRGN